MRNFVRNNNEETLSSVGGPSAGPSAMSGKAEILAGQLDTGGSTSESVRAVLARLNKPLQRRTSGKHMKRDSVTSIVTNLANNVRKKDKEPGQPLTTLLEASQSMSSFFTDGKQTNPAAHAKSASSTPDKVALTRRAGTGGLDGLSPSDNKEIELDKGIETAVNTAFGPLKSSKQTSESKEANARELLNLLRLPENRTCADCDGADPRWASWNLGVFLCIRCSGIHRGLGTHVSGSISDVHRTFANHELRSSTQISKVRSVDLDDWTDEQLFHMREGGNEHGREIWEPVDLPREMRTDE